MLHVIFSIFLLFALPAEAGKFRRVKTTGPLTIKTNLADVPVESEQAEYVAANGERFAVERINLPSEGTTYEALTSLAAEARTANPGLELGAPAGTAGFLTKDRLVFFRGKDLVSVTSLRPGSDTAERLTALGQSLSESLELGEGEIPVLIKHLPNPDQAEKTVIFRSSFDTLTLPGLDQPVLTAVRADGNADAALATFDSGKVLLVEYHTPQLATENDQRIIARIQELWKLGQPAPTAYRRVGNYSVFVFDAPDEQTAKQLIDQVKYEQVVSWLGENPNILRDAQERYVNTTLAVLVAVLKASGYAVVLCLGIGGLIGGLLFTYRRSQQKAATAYSDAGGMLRLNLDELTTDNRK